MPPRYIICFLRMKHFRFYCENNRTNAVITARKRSLGQGNIFTPVCHSVHMGGMRGYSVGGCMVARGVCMVAPRGACVVAPRGCAWLLGGGHGWLLWGGGGHAWLLLGGMRSCSGGVHGFIRGACMFFSVFSDTMRYGQ